MIDIEENELHCEECEMELKYQRCPCCECSFEIVTKPEDHRFILSKANIKEFNLPMKSGVYQVLRYPFFYGDIISGFDGVFEDAIKLINEIDIDEIMQFSYGKDTEPINADEICDECYDIYSDKKYIKNNSLHHNITLRGLIKNGNRT